MSTTTNPPPVVPAWRDAPVWVRDGNILVSGTHPDWGRGIFSFLSPPGLLIKLCYDATPEAARLHLREALRLPSGFRFDVGRKDANHVLDGGPTP